MDFLTALKKHAHIYYTKGHIKKPVHKLFALYCNITCASTFQITTVISSTSIFISKYISLVAVVKKLLFICKLLNVTT